MNVPISIGGMVINPGDLICGDPDGLLSVPMDDAEFVCNAASKKHKAETKQMDNIRAGKNDRTWVDAALQKQECHFGA